MAADKRSDESTSTQAPSLAFQSCIHIAATDQPLAMSVAITFDLPALQRSFQNEYLSLCAYCAGTFHSSLRELHLVKDAVGEAQVSE